ncbi:MULTISPECIES: transcriptional regulator [Nitrosomonas]|uniref:DNA-binding transcriptional regulator YdaS (Cro superfamily) n=1 Tax=Nitrosomonas communis TaxID=44574 RepID=A0A5D3YBK1_9PROT|nr:MULTISPECIES: Cro/CI family transcriptional regulator [Nitrosomonas]TYP74172.1 DNA-binding transcriptional regulator YdaS (Cro superfamily) [Nitrosomonas communis]UVS62570.1 helix-turn-helix domain-containing protein [Nitrosomonas sp. PLL12]
MSKEHIKNIAKRVGGVVALSKKLGLSRAAVSQWEVIPADRILDVEKITGIPREELRPDLYVRKPATSEQIIAGELTERRIYQRRQVDRRKNYRRKEYRRVFDRRQS